MRDKRGVLILSSLHDSSRLLYEPVKALMAACIYLQLNVSPTVNHFQPGVILSLHVITLNLLPVCCTGLASAYPRLGPMRSTSVALCLFSLCRALALMFICVCAILMAKERASGCNVPHVSNPCRHQPGNQAVQEFRGFPTTKAGEDEDEKCFSESS